MEKLGQLLSFRQELLYLKRGSLLGVNPTKMLNSSLIFQDNVLCTVNCPEMCFKMTFTQICLQQALFSSFNTKVLFCYFHFSFELAAFTLSVCWQVMRDCLHLCFQFCISLKVWDICNENLKIKQLWLGNPTNAAH